MYVPLLFFTNKQIANNSYTRVACTNNKTAASEKYTRKEKHKTEILDHHNRCDIKSENRGN